MSIEKEYECETKNSPFLIRLTKNKKIKSINYTEEFKLWREKRTNKVDADRCSLFHPIRGVCGAGNPNICGHCGKHKNEHD